VHQDTVEHCRIPQYQPKEIKPKKKRAKKTEEASKPMTRAKVKEAPKMSDPEIIRPEFAQVRRSQHMSTPNPKYFTEEMSE
jgi:hypothetical protein